MTPSSTARPGLFKRIDRRNKRGPGIYRDNTRDRLEDPATVSLHTTSQSAESLNPLQSYHRMRPSYTISPDLFTRVDQWAQEMVGHAEQPNQTRISGGGMKLRSLPARKGLTEISINSNSRKRKASAAMDGTNKAGAKARIDSEPPKQRGRPPGSKNKAQQANKDADDEVYNQFDHPSYNQLPSSIPDLPPPSESSAKSGSPSRKGMSPGKKGIFALNKAKSEAAIDMAYLRTCTPAVKQTNIPALKASKKQIPPAVLSLYNKLLNIPRGAFPSELKSSYKNDIDTPRKTKDPIPSSDYLPPSATPYPSQYLDRLKMTIDKVYVKAAKAHETGAHERQWGALVNQLLCEAELWAEENNITVLNVENCSIQPDVMRPTRPEGAGYIDLETQTNSTRTVTTEAAESIGRMIDWCLGLGIDDDDMDIILLAWRKLLDHEFSLNQCISYVSSYLLLVDFEIKKKVANRDPLVQLAIWESGGLLKKRHHGWDTSMPMPGITINGHLWECYLFFELNKDLMMVGPIPFGTTSTLNGIWQIVYGLHILMKWGQTEYMTWFKEHIIEGWARDKAR